MSGLARILSILQLVGVAGWVLTAAPVVHAADARAKKETPWAADLHKKEADLRASLKTDPDNASLHVKLGQLYLDEGKVPAAEAQMRAARNNGQNDEADGWLAWILLVEGERNVLFTQIKPGDREPHAEAMVRMSLGVAYLDTGSYDNADSMLHDAVRLDPDAWRAHISLALVLMLERKLTEAHEQIDAAQKLAPNEIGVTRIAGEIYRAAGDTDAAIAKFNTVLGIEPKSVPTLAARADAFISQNKLAEARKDIEAGLAITRNSYFWFLDALILARQDKTQEAEKVLQQINGQFDRSPIGFYLEGIVQLKLGQPETAEFNLARFQGHQPNASAVACLRAEMALNRSDPAVAVRILEPVVTASPTDQTAVACLARAYLANDQANQVIRLYEKVMDDSDKPNAPELDTRYLRTIGGDAAGDYLEIEKIWLGKDGDAVVPMTELRNGDVAKAAAATEALAKEHPDSLVIQNLLGTVRMAQQRLPDAEIIFRDLTSKNPDYKPAALNLVQVLVQESREPDARQVLQEMQGHN